VGDTSGARDAMWLAIVPLGVAFVLGVLLLPRRAAPESVPLPVPDARALARVVAADRELAERARREPLPAAVRALGSAVRAFHTLEAQGAEGYRLSEARQAVDTAVVGVSTGSPEPLLELRAVELESFLAELRRFESEGAQSEELAALSGAFIRSMTIEGWCSGRDLAPDPAALRTMFKHMWNGFLGMDARPELRPTLDEERALYAFYLSHAHPSKGMRDALAAARRGARDEAACAALEEAERGATESWRLEHITRLATIDPSYPADYARGVATFRRGDFGASTKAFRAWVRDHPEGPLALRAQNYLRGASAADRVE
jgi:hypothetical protein